MLLFFSLFINCLSSLCISYCLHAFQDMKLCGACHQSKEKSCFSKTQLRRLITRCQKCVASGVQHLQQSSKGHKSRIVKIVDTGLESSRFTHLGIQGTHCTPQEMKDARSLIDATEVGPGNNNNKFSFY